MTPDEIAVRFTSALDEMIEHCRLTEEFVDKERFQVLVATVWGNVVLDPEGSGIAEGDLEKLHDFLNSYLRKIVGPDASITGCYEFIVSKEGEDCLTRQQVTRRHREFLHHFARLILPRKTLG